MLVQITQIQEPRPIGRYIRGLQSSDKGKVRSCIIVHTNLNDFLLTLGLLDITAVKIKRMNNGKASSLNNLLEVLRMFLSVKEPSGRFGNVHESS